MKMKLHIKLIFLLTITIGISACEEMILGPQPHFLEDVTYEPMLNIMGVLRPDSMQSFPMTFIQVEKTVIVPYDTNESTDVFNAKVEVYKMENNQPIDTIVFHQTRFGGAFVDSTYRSDAFYPKAGETYSVLCQYENLPILTSETTIPDEPQIAGNLINFKLTRIKFSIVLDSAINLYDVVLTVNGEAYTMQRYFRENYKDVDISLPVSMSAFSTTDTVEMIVYAYDKKLSEYMTNSPSAIWPNTYQPAYSTVENGYGCFGSLNLRKWRIN